MQHIGEIKIVVVVAHCLLLAELVVIWLENGGSGLVQGEDIV